MSSRRGGVLALFAVLVAGFFAAGQLDLPAAAPAPTTAPDRLDLSEADTPSGLVEVAPVLERLDALEVKGRAPKTGYERAEFGNGWAGVEGCDVRNRILARDLTDLTYDNAGCIVESGGLHDPYTGDVVEFVRGQDTSSEVHIDHVVSLSDAWQKGAQYWPVEDRVAFANDPANLLAVTGSANQAKGDGDAATWLPPNRDFWCQLVAIQVDVKHTYQLWVTPAEHESMTQILGRC